MVSSATDVNEARSRLGPAVSVATQLGSCHGIGKQPRKHLLERDVAEQLSLRAGGGVARGITIWALICRLDLLAEHTAVSHTRANDGGLWDFHVTPDFCIGWAMIVRRNERAKQLDHAFELVLHVTRD
jgi:hypothetical protein